MRPMPRCATLLLLTLAARPGLGQSEGHLRAVFEGKTVRVKIEMPGAQEGVDLRPGTPNPIDYNQHTGRLKKFGVAYRPGDAAIITKVRVSGDHIEFQLGAGGFGTFGDDANTTVDARTASKSQREKDLEAALKSEIDAKKKRDMDDELNRLRDDRRREDARNATRAAEASAIKEVTVRQRRLESGSRFNLRYKGDVPSEFLTPESVMAALAEYVDFSNSYSAPGAAPQPVMGGLKKGMTLDDVDAMMGRPESIGSRMEGTLTVSTSTYRTKDRKVIAEFVEGVLIRFSVVSQ